MRFMPVVVRYFRDFLRKTKSPQPAGAKPGPRGIRYDTLSRIFHNFYFTGTTSLLMNFIDYYTNDIHISQ